ncbi:MAG: type II toxin-antitoxin system RelE/ParE family toxin [Endozoicomonadaceae bacterium]|nr:type II toxin-antitoxin system RelE/ParE family toxin [Endozoicomonadaceae bacterium]
MTEYRLLKKAEKDIANIANYTIQKFGIKQAGVYRDGLFRSFEIISDFPLIGSSQHHTKKNIRRHVHEHHSIYYRVDAHGVTIYRILGPGEDPLQNI